MTPNNNLSILPFYTDIQKQNHRKDYAFGEVFPLFTPDRKILPFQIIRPHRWQDMAGAWIMNADGTLFADAFSNMVDTGLRVNKYQSKGYDVIMYNGAFPMSINAPQGRYYLQISDGVQEWYSDIYTVSNNLSDCLLIEFWDSNNLEFDGGSVEFTEGFKFNVYLPTQLGRPEYVFEEQVEKREGFQFVEKQISEKTYRFNFIAPEYLLDAMRIIRMMDNVVISNRNDVYRVNQFLITPKWQDGGFLASVEAEFQCNSVIKKIGSGVQTLLGGDFSNDYNNDFNN